MSNVGEKPEAYTGYLTKKGKLLKTWKKRFFVLDGNGTMLYFKDRESYDKLKTSTKDLRTLALGWFDVRNRKCGPCASASAKYQYTFEVLKKKFKLKVENS